MLYKTIPNFSPHAKTLRKHFERRFGDPHRSSADRFVWDYWHIPQEYTFLRTPAWQFFPKNIYEKFHRELVYWGREVLGCHDVSPTWLSCYVEGCEQRLHRDEPHGPLAFVLSLTPWEKRKFSGGFTRIQKSNGRGFHSVSSKFNQLLVFNPDVLHGVKKVSGVADPLKGRLVLHGWFVQPRVFWKGPLKPRQIEATLSDQLDTVLSDSFRHLRGFCSSRLWLRADGHVDRVQLLAETLPSEEDWVSVAKCLKTLRFPAAKRASQVTLPLVFRS